MGIFIFIHQAMPYQEGGICFIEQTTSIYILYIWIKTTTILTRKVGLKAAGLGIQWASRSVDKSVVSLDTQTAWSSAVSRVARLGTYSMINQIKSNNFMSGFK